MNFNRSFRRSIQSIALFVEIKKFTMHMKAMFYVKVKFSHSFHFETNQTKTIKEVTTNIGKEIRSRTNKIFAIFDVLSFATTFFFFFVILKYDNINRYIRKEYYKTASVPRIFRVVHYRYKWLTSERYDNRYITNDIRTIDLIRARQEKETVLPLNPREQKRYASLTSTKLIKPERVKLARSLVFLSMATMKLITFMAIDYSLFWILKMIQIYGRYQSKVKQRVVLSPLFHIYVYVYISISLYDNF